MNPAFLVDGVTEQRFIQEVCRTAPVKIINCNGTTVIAAAIARRAATLIRLWKGRYYPIVIIVDREDRAQSSESFTEELNVAIRAEGIRDDIIIGVADRMIENWILGDNQVWGNSTPPDNVDGINGCAKLKKLLPEYDKASQGPRLLKEALPSNIRIRSASFNSFYQRLIDINCRWLTK